MNVLNQGWVMKTIRVLNVNVVPATGYLKACMKPAYLVGLVSISLMSACASKVVQLNPEPVLQGAAYPISSGASLEVAKSERVVELNTVNTWHVIFNDPVLSELIEKALANNTDVRLAASRVEEASAILGVTRALQTPSVYGQINETRSRQTQAGSNPQMNNPNINESTRLGLGISWELDLWGRLAAGTDAAKARLQQQQYLMDAMRLSIGSTVAQLYFQAKALAVQLNVLERTQQSRKKAYQLAKSRFDVGLSNELVLRQAEAEWRAVDAQLPDTREGLQQVIHALSRLLGQTEPALLDVHQTASIKVLNEQAPWVMASGTPSDLLLSRPDLAAAEQALKAAQADVTAARRALFPSIELSAFGGRESAALDNLFTGPAKIWNFSAGLTQPIFQAGRLQRERDAALSRSNQAVLQYEASIRTAFAEVLDAMVAQREARERLQARQEQVDTLNEVARLAKVRVDGGVSSLFEQLDAERNLLQAELSLASAWQQQRIASVNLIKALGGTPNEQATSNAPKQISQQAVQ